MKYKFDETLMDFMEGHLSYKEANERLTGVALDTQQAQMWKDLKPLDESLSERTEFRSELPWLITRVTSRVNARQRAKEWMKQQEQGMVGRMSFEYSQIISPLAWKVFGAGIIGGFTGFLMGSQVDLFQQYQARVPHEISLPFVMAVFLGLIVALMVVSPSLRKYYS